jgi:hypothetical protein
MNVTARLAVEVGQAPRSTTNSCMSLNAAEFAGSGASSRAAGSRVRGWEGAERRAAAARTRYAPGTRRRRHRPRRRRRCSFHSLLSRRVGDWDRTGSKCEGERTGGFACWDSTTRRESGRRREQVRVDRAGFPRREPGPCQLERSLRDRASPVGGHELRRASSVGRPGAQELRTRASTRVLRRASAAASSPCPSP